MAVLLIGAVSAVDSNDASIAENSTNQSQDDVEEVVIQNATFDKVSKSNYLIGDSFEVNLLDDNGTGIANKSVYFSVEDKVSEVFTNENGTASFLLNFKKGIYLINYNFNDTGYNPIKGSKKILLLSKPVSTIKGSNMNAYAGVKKTFKVTLKADGIPLSGRKVLFTVKKKTYTRKTDSNGEASLTIHMYKGKYTIKYDYLGEENINSSKGSAKVTIKLLKNPYKTKYRTVVIDADGGFTKAFLKDVAKQLRIGGWKVIIKGIGPNQHSINYWKVKNAVYMPFYNGLCAATIKEMTYNYYGGLIKLHKSVLAPSWYTNEWVSAKMSQYRNDITKIKYLKRAWDDNFSPKSFKGISYPAKFMTQNNIKYTVGDTSYKIVEQFLFGGWQAHH